MSRRRLLDVLLLLNASRGVAGRHISHQQRQLDLRIRTSSLTKEANAQLDHIVLALQAASELSRKFDNSRQQHSGETVSNEQGDIGGSRHEQNDENFSVKKGETELDREADINQGIQSTSGDELPRETLSTQNPTGRAGDVLNAVPEGPRHPIELAGSHTPSMPAEDGFGDAMTAASRDEHSEAIMRQLFRSRRVASILTKDSKYGVNQRNREPTKIDRSPAIDSSPRPEILNKPPIKTAIAPEMAEPSATPEVEKGDVSAVGADLANNTVNLQVH